MLKKTNRIPVFLLAGVLVLILAMGLFAREDPAQISKVNKYFAKPSQDRVFRTMCNIGNWGHWIDHDGRSAHTPGDDSGGFYPRGTAAVIYLDGLVWGGYVNDSNPQNPRVGGCTYNVGTAPGWIVTPGTTGATSAVAVDANDSRVQIWRIRRDWATLTLNDVKRDAAEINEVDVEAVTDAQAQAVLDDYAYAWNNWPTDVGAPYYDNNDNGVYDTGDEPGIADADQIIWFATNDLNQSRTIGLYGSDPMGIEVQLTMWAYNQPGATLGQLIFKKFKFINKSGVRIDSMFVSQWSDADVGTYTDDLAGCDTALSVGFGYSGFITDGQFSDFGLPPGCVGYDFFQGPIVPSPGDTAVFDLQYLPDYRNLPMTSFLYFAAGSPISDPPLADYDGTLEWYNMLNGYIPTVSLTKPTPYTVGNLGVTPTKFPLAGDPFRGTGDVDATLNNFQPGDRRLGMCSGPFTMEPGDVQEVVVAVVGGIVPEVGGNNVNAVEQMKINDQLAQFVYDNLFQALPKAPAAPKVKVSELNNQVMLDWGSDQAAVAETEKPDLILGFEFEGYNIYQLPTATATKEQATLIATYDKVNQVRTIRGSKFIASFGDILEVPLQKGTDNGLVRYFLLEKDYINDLPLYNGNTYYFAITGYNYNPDPDVPEPTLESGLTAIAVVPQTVKPGVRYGGEIFATLDVEHTVGSSDGVVQVTVIDPAATTGHNYEVFFTEDTDTNSATFGQLLWNVRDATAGQVKVSGQVQAATLDETETQPIFDGLQVKVTGPALDFKNFTVVANANGPVDPPEQGCFAFNNNGFPFLNGSDRPNGARQQSNGSAWGINHSTPGSPGYSDFVARVTQYTGGFGEPAPVGLAFLIPRDYEIRFTGTPAAAFYRWPYLSTPNPAFVGTVPFELWCVGDVADPADDFQCYPWISDDDSSGTFNLLQVDHGVSGGGDDPYTDAIYWLEPLSRTQAGYDALAAAHVADPAGANAEVLWAYKTAYDPWNCVAGMMRMVLVNWNGGSVSDAGWPGNVNALMPEDGTIFRIITAKPNLITDTFSFTAPAVTQLASNAEADVEKVNVFPNPYYAYNPSEPDRFTHFITFNHLPTRATIRIFNLAGVQVRKLEKNSDTQFQRWDLTNERDIPVASGMYIAYIDMPDQGKEKVLKLMIIQSQEQLKYY